jgi:hypothetical protein
MISLPLVFHVHNPKFQNVLAQTLSSHSHESSAAENKVCLVIVIEIGQNHCSSFSATKSCVLASYLPMVPPDRSKQSLHTGHAGDKLKHN